MWIEVVKWGLVAGGMAITAAAAWAVWNWDQLLLEVVAPWARARQLGGVLDFLVRVDRWASAFRRVAILFVGQKGKARLGRPSTVTEQVMLEADLPPELRRVGTHPLALNAERLVNGIFG